MQESTGQAALSYLKPLLLFLFEIVLSCGIWYLLLGPKGILVGFGQYLVGRFAIFFWRVFAPVPKNSSLGSPPTK